MTVSVSVTVSVTETVTVTVRRDLGVGVGLGSLGEITTIGEIAELGLTLIRISPN